jgi:hypothetical protein
LRQDREVAHVSVKVSWLVGTEEGDMESTVMLNVFEIRKWVNCFRMGFCDVSHFVTCLIRTCSLLKCIVKMCRKENGLCSELV